MFSMYEKRAHMDFLLLENNCFSSVLISKADVFSDHVSKTGCDSTDATFLTWLCDSVYSCSSPLAAASPSTASPDTGTWHLRTIATKWTGRKQTTRSIATIVKTVFFYHFKSKTAAVSMRCSSVRGGLIDISRRNSKRYKRPVRLGAASSSPACRKDVEVRSSVRQQQEEWL